MGGEQLAAIALKDLGNTQTLYPFIHCISKVKTSVYPARIFNHCLLPGILGNYPHQPKTK
jgi:hypothetical protein